MKSNTWSIKLQNTDDSILQTLLSETWSTVVLDSGASTAVCGKFEQYTKSLPPEKQTKVFYLKSTKPSALETTDSSNP